MNKLNPKLWPKKTGKNCLWGKKKKLEEADKLYPKYSQKKKKGKNV